MAHLLDDSKLLVVDDEYSNAEVILNLLQNQTNQVYYAPNGKIGCDLAEKQKPDLIIMDWQMPEMDGIEAIKKLKANPETKEIPIIVATGVMTSVENLKEALDSGAEDFLRKPFDPIEFKARTRTALRIRAQHNTIKQMLIQEKQYIQDALEHKERELTSMAVFDHQKNALMDQMLEQIGRLDRITNHVYATEIKAIEKELRNHVQLKDSWDNFKLHFDEMHAGFFDKLDAEFPSLTLNERKLCAYVKMGMGNFEITQMTGTSDGAIRKAINRMKKKLNLGADDDLRHFIFEF